MLINDQRVRQALAIGCMRGAVRVASRFIYQAEDRCGSSAAVMPYHS